MLPFIWFLAVVYSVNCASAPFIKPCKSSDTDCLIASAQAAVPIVAAGIPELGVRSLDPMKIPVVKSNTAGLEVTFSDNVVTGLKGCKIESLKNDLTKNKQVVIMRCSTEWRGNYKMDGQMIVLPVKGEGKCVMTVQDIVIKTTIDLTTVQGDDGKPHWHINKWKHAYDVKTNAKFQFDNLFNGNKILGDPVLNFMNSNWQVVMKEMAGPSIYATSEAVVEAVEAIYKAVPAEELFIS
ncbi:circadian clock-controlled protein daywake-like [Galleria mellonella]|uniref:Circadian clock-controlled protein daywake-like n=1 Tax=Galleria mellonella TaxID=7137 RepID=A0A6J1W7F6_GALME|nr:circadian clock-controlled protein daywake-like [Galleria mellonella]